MTAHFDFAADSSSGLSAIVFSNRVSFTIPDSLESPKDGHHAWIGVVRVGDSTLIDRDCWYAATAERASGFDWDPKFSPPAGSFDMILVRPRGDPATPEGRITFVQHGPHGGSSFGVNHDLSHLGVLATPAKSLAMAAASGALDAKSFSKALADAFGAKRAGDASDWAVRLLESFVDPYYPKRQLASAPVVEERWGAFWQGEGKHARDVQCADWTSHDNEVISARGSSGGSAGVLFVKTRSGTAVIKRTDDQDFGRGLFVTALAKHLFHLWSPKMRRLAPGSAEIDELRNAVHSLYEPHWEHRWSGDARGKGVCDISS